MDSPDQESQGSETKATVQVLSIGSSKMTWRTAGSGSFPQHDTNLGWKEMLLKQMRARGTTVVASLV